MSPTCDNFAGQGRDAKPETIVESPTAGGDRRAAAAPPAVMPPQAEGSAAPQERIACTEDDRVAPLPGVRSLYQV